MALYNKLASVQFSFMYVWFISAHPSLSLSPLSADLTSTNRSSIFSGLNGQLSLSSVLLDEYRDRLFLGGKDVLYSVLLGPTSTEAKEVRSLETAPSYLST